MSNTRPTGTREWAASSVNVMSGCEHDCLYCYAKTTAKRYKTHEGPWNEAVVVPSLATKRFGKRKGTVMFPTTHDITPGNLEHCLPVLRRLLEAGNKVLIVSKPHPEVIGRIIAKLAEYKDQVLFRFTIGSMNDAILKFWEPGAPTFSERLDSLRFAHQQGWATSVSMEPMLDLEEDDIVACYEAVVPYVTDNVWLGKMNKVVERLKRNGIITADDPNPEVSAQAGLLMGSQSDERIKALYDRLKDCPHIRWKESVKAVVGIESPAEVGMDI